MKPHDEHNDETLHSFVDGELSARQRTEVKRLAAHDEAVAVRFAWSDTEMKSWAAVPRTE